ncbi:MAG: ATP synthase subunit C [Candidatus Helarchaeota archaeon]
MKFKKNKKIFILTCVFAFLVYVANATTIIVVMAAQVHIAQTEASFYKFIAAAIAVAGSGIGAGYAIANTGSAAIALLSEKDEMFIKAFIIVSLAEALAIYGLVVGLLMIFI